MTGYWLRVSLVFVVVLLLFGAAEAQIDEICSAAGLTPSLDGLSSKGDFQHIPYVFGRITLNGFDPAAKRPKVVITLSESGQSPARWTVDKSGNYCFKRASGGGSLLVEVDGIEAARRALPSFGAAQEREDFDVYPAGSQRPVAPGSVSAKFLYPPNERTAELYSQLSTARSNKDSKRSVEILKQITATDAADFTAWRQLGYEYLLKESYPDADAAYRRALTVRVDYTPAWIEVGQLRIAQKQYDAGIEILKHAIELDGSSAKAYRLLGEAYLQAKKGTLGAEALNQAIKLDPIGMAECHLELAHLYDLAGAKPLASREYRVFLTKMPDHPDRKKLEKYIKDNP